MLTHKGPDTRIHGVAVEGYIEVPCHGRSEGIVHGSIVDSVPICATGR